MTPDHMHVSTVIFLPRYRLQELSKTIVMSFCVFCIMPQDTLRLVLKLRVTAGGVPKVGSITYELQKPLFARLLEQSSS